MIGKTDLTILLKTMEPKLNAGSYVFCTTNDPSAIDPKAIIMLFKESESYTVIIPQAFADSLLLPYAFVAAWITLTVHSSLTAVGLTAAFATALTQQNISCNVVAAFYHDHIFVDIKDCEKAMVVLKNLAS